MSRFLSKATAAMQPYTPGEQPRDKQYIKLNTNESPYPPAPEVSAAILTFDANDLRLYPDPTAKVFVETIADIFAVNANQVFAGGGSDEALAYAFMAFFDRGDKVYFPDITYGFYKVYADLFGLEAVQIPLQENFSIKIEDYFGLDGNIFIANPNAPTGICLEIEEVEEILRHNKDRLIVLDEAYIDFAGGKSCVDLIKEYDNLLIVQTFSKSRGLAGMRLGVGIGDSALIEGLERIKFSFNPYNLDRISFEVGIASLINAEYMQESVGKVVATRERVSAKLEKLGFYLLPSKANFIFAKSDKIGGRELYDKLKEKGILVRHFSTERIKDFVRITIGTDAEMDVLISRLEEML